MTTLRYLASALMLVGLFLGGCTTDQPLFTNQRDARLEGVELYNRADYENAAGAFRNSVRQDPRDYRSQFYLGLTYERLGNYQQALQSYKSTLKIMQETPVGRDDVDWRQMTMNTLATLIRNHDSSGLEQDLLARQASDAKFDGKARAEAYFLLAKIARYRRDADSALTNYSNGYPLNPDDFLLQKEAGLYILQMGQNNKAVKPIRRAAQLNSRDTEVLAALRQLKIEPNGGLIDTGTNLKPLFKGHAMPAIDLKVGEPVTLPDQLPVQ